MYKVVVIGAGEINFGECSHSPYLAYHPEAVTES